MDFESSSNITETKAKKPKLQSPQEQSRKKKLEPRDLKPSSPQVTQTIHIAEIHHPPSSKISVNTQKKVFQIESPLVQKKKEN